MTKKATTRTAVVLGIDPAKRSHAMAVIDGREQQLAQPQVPNSNDGYREMLRLAPLVHAQNHRLLRRIQTQPDDVADLGVQLGSLNHPATRRGRPSCTGVFGRPCRSAARRKAGSIPATSTC